MISFPPRFVFSFVLCQCILLSDFLLTRSLFFLFPCLILIIPHHFGSVSLLLFLESSRLCTILHASLNTLEVALLIKMIWSYSCWCCVNVLEMHLNISISANATWPKHRHLNTLHIAVPPFSEFHVQSSCALVTYFTLSLPINVFNRHSSLDWCLTSKGHWPTQQKI